MFISLFQSFCELKSDILFICMDNMCASWSHDFEIYCDWPPSICSLRLLIITENRTTYIVGGGIQWQ